MEVLYGKFSKLFINAFSGLDKNVVVFLISMFPLLELRGGMIAAAVFKMPYLQAMVLCY